MIRCAFDQSIYSVESALPQNSRSASSSLNVGIFFRGFKRSPFPRIHVARRYRSDEIAANRKRNEQPPPAVCLTEGEVSSLAPGMRDIGPKRDRLVEKDLF